MSADSLSVAEASERSGIPERQLRKLLRGHTVRGEKVNGRWEVDATSLVQLSGAGCTPDAAWTEIINEFTMSPWFGPLLALHLSAIEERLCGTGSEDLSPVLGEAAATSTVLASAIRLKGLAGQINVVVHALGVLLSLPRILEPGERVERLSLGAGSTGKPFDLETTHRVAEFKLAQWRGGPEAIRQNQLFKDLFLLAEYPTTKQLRCLYVVGTKGPMDFLHSNRRLDNVLGRNVRLKAMFEQRHGGRFATVSEYYHEVKDRVKILDLAVLLPELQQLAAVLE